MFEFITYYTRDVGIYIYIYTEMKDEMDMSDIIKNLLPFVVIKCICL